MFEMNPNKLKLNQLYLYTGNILEIGAPCIVQYDEPTSIMSGLVIYHFFFYFMPLYGFGLSPYGVRYQIHPIDKDFLEYVELFSIARGVL